MQPDLSSAAAASFSAVATLFISAFAHLVSSVLNVLTAHKTTWNAGASTGTTMGATCGPTALIGPKNAAASTSPPLSADHDEAIRDALTSFATQLNARTSGFRCHPPSRAPSVFRAHPHGAPLHQRASTFQSALSPEVPSSLVLYSLLSATSTFEHRS